MNKYCIYWIGGGKILVKAVCEADAIFKACLLHNHSEGDIDRITILMR